MPIDQASIRTVVQRNCHIADARIACDYSLCIYLLKMREYYRWEKAYDFDMALPKQELGKWIRERESLWEELESEDFADIPVDGEFINPFETKQINSSLSTRGLVYSGGLGISSKPHFFLAEYLRHENRFGYDVYITNRELARDLSAYPAMSQDKTIFVRRESIRRMVWEKLEEWRWNQPDNAMKRALAAYNYDGDMTRVLDAMTEDVLELTVLHEIGEIMAGQQLGEKWHEILASLPRSKLEFMLRAVRDHLADAMCTLPALIKHGSKPLLHFYFAILSAYSKTLAPKLIQAYNLWVESNDLDHLKKWTEQSAVHWSNIGSYISTNFQQSTDTIKLKTYEKYLEQNTF